MCEDSIVDVLLRCGAVTAFRTMTVVAVVVVVDGSDCKWATTKKQQRILRMNGEHFNRYALRTASL